jgi:hypothetical protein
MSMWTVVCSCCAPEPSDGFDSVRTRWTQRDAMCRVTLGVADVASLVIPLTSAVREA